MTISRLVLVSVGNSRTRIALARPWDGPHGSIDPSRVLENGQPDAVAAAVREAAGGGEPGSTAILMASVNKPVSDALAGAVAGGYEVVQMTSDDRGQRVPMQTDLTPPVTVGVDRLLAGMGAASRSGEACVVIDAGTAVTVDFVDAFGVFKGGVIAPGLAMQLRALHERTSALPAVEPPRAGSGGLPQGPAGKSTREAMLLGCAGAVQGLVRLMVDRYAEANGSYPRVIATGGDAPLLFENDDLVEQIVPDLIPMGMLSAWRLLHHTEGQDAS